MTRPDAAEKVSSIGKPANQGRNRSNVIQAVADAMAKVLRDGLHAEVTEVVLPCHGPGPLVVVRIIHTEAFDQAGLGSTARPLERRRDLPEFAVAIHEFFRRWGSGGVAGGCSEPKERGGHVAYGPVGGVVAGPIGHKADPVLEGRKGLPR